MKIQLIGFDFGLKLNQKRKLFIEIVNGSDADLILFPGHTLRDLADLYNMEPDLTNEKSVVVLELEDHYPTCCLHLHNALVLVREGLAEDLYTSQIFTSAEEINREDVLMAKLLDEMPRRQFECCGKRITVLLCGETALLESTEAENYRATFRFKDNAELNRRYEEMLASTDIFLNPIHTPQGRQWVMAQRRATLSADGRYYFLTGSLPQKSAGKLKSKSLQYIWHDGKELTIKPVIYEKGMYVSRIIEI